MKKKWRHRSHKLSLSAETLRKLTPDQLAVVNGGAVPTWSYCPSDREVLVTRETECVASMCC